MDENKSFVIEIRQEVAVMLIFLVAGVILVYAAFTIPHKSTEIWPELNAGGIAAGAYLIALLCYILRKPLRPKLRVKAALVACIVVGAVIFSWVRMAHEARWHADTIMEIRKNIGYGIRFAKMPRILLKTLDAYYRQGNRAHESLGNVFRRLNQGAVVGSNINTPDYPGDKMNVCVRTIEPDKIVLVSQETFVKGQDPLFKNFDGKTGMVQEEYTLTAKGITHASEN